MPDKTDEAVELSATDIVLEALKIIRSEILAYAVIVAVLLIGTGALGLDVLRELKWPLVIVFTVALVAYFFARAVPRAKTALRLRSSAARRPGVQPDDRR
jgi:hypothetical protein